MSERDFTEDFGHENGNYECLCSTCRNTFVGHKRRVVCKVCARAAVPKWTVEERPELYVMDEKGLVVCLVGGFSGNKSELHKKRARMLCASPQMMSALQEVANFWLEPPDDREEYERRASEVSKVVVDALDAAVNGPLPRKG